jgi:uncharacterized protein involved in exopolysaccharide biosynthesis
MNQNKQLTQDYEDEHERADLARYWNGVRRRKWPILVLAVAASVVAALYALSITPIYPASTTILIESQPANVISIEEVYELDTRSQQYFETQVEILYSRPLAEMVIETLNLVDEPEFSASAEGIESTPGWRSWLPFDLPGQTLATPSGPMSAAIRPTMHGWGWSRFAVRNSFACISSPNSRSSLRAWRMLTRRLTSAAC